MDPRFSLSTAIGKLTSSLLKLKKSGATAAPGLFSLYLDKNALKKLSGALERTIIVTGTNGKTTTSRVIGSFFDSQQVSYLHNRHGSNLERGLVSALLEQASFGGKVSKKTALFEVDEAALAAVLPKLNPKIVLLTNLFRDQLDRYGEVDNIKRLWQKTLESLKPETVLIVNADDPNLAFLGSQASGKVIYFGISDTQVKQTEVPSSLDVINCPNCGAKLAYSAYYSSHQGDYSCPSCPFKRPDLDFTAKNISLQEAQTQFAINAKETNPVEIKTPLLGLYNIYNLLAAYTVLSSTEANLNLFPKVAETYKTAFGRGEKFSFGDREILVTLAKNPTGFNEILQTFISRPKQTVLILINDKIADGRDVSWLWDVDFEKIVKLEPQILTSGIRGSDMNLRLKYAGIKRVEYIESSKEAFQKALDLVPKGETLNIIPTYTALLDLKKHLAKKGIGQQFWQD